MLFPFFPVSIPPLVIQDGCANGTPAFRSMDGTSLAVRPGRAPDPRFKVDPRRG